MYNIGWVKNKNSVGMILRQVIKIPGKYHTHSSNIFLLEIFIKGTDITSNGYFKHMASCLKVIVSNY